MLAYLPQLDGLRGVAIILVLLHHLTIYRPASGIDEWIASVPLIGWCGVDLFFVLSGFLITGILIDSRDSTRYFTSFYARRTLRIFPLYYVCVFAALILLPMLPTLHRVIAGPYADPPQLPYWLYLTNFSVASRGLVHGWLDIAWSLAIEEQFYIVWAVVVWICLPRWLGWICGALVLLAPIARAIAVSRGVDTTTIYVLTWFRVDALAMGALLAWLMRRNAFPSLARFAPWVAVAGIAGLAAITIDAGESWWWTPWMQTAGYSLTLFTGASMLVLALSRPADSLWPRLLSMGWLRAFGKYAYSLYLFHLPVMRLMREYVFDPGKYEALALTPWIGQMLFYAAAIAPAFALSWVSWKFFEAPILRLKERFPY